MTIYVITATETAGPMGGLSFSKPLKMTQRDIHIAAGMDFNVDGWPRTACRNDDERTGWDRAQELKEL